LSIDIDYVALKQQRCRIAALTAEGHGSTHSIEQLAERSQDNEHLLG